MKHIGLIVGHTPSSHGAKNTNMNTSEFSFNNQLASDLAFKLREVGYLPTIIYRDTYSNLPEHVNSINPDIAIALHCNAFNKQTSGGEVLYYHKSTKGKRLAEALVNSISNTLGNNNRGAKPIDYDHEGSKGDRGGWLVEKTSMPVVIAEPFFIDNQDELVNVKMRYAKLVNAYVEGIKQYYGKHDGTINRSASIGINCYWCSFSYCCCLTSNCS